MARSWPHDVTLPDPTLPLRDRLRHLLDYVRLAPSIRNSQPWRLRLGDAWVELHAERARALPVADPAGRGLTISCGAALAFLKVAAHAAGLATAIERLPGGPDKPDLLARLTITGEAKPATEEPWLLQAMPKRRTHRGVFSSHRVSPSLLRRLVALADAHGAPITLVEGPGRQVLLELAEDADRAQRRDPAFARELAAWVAPGRPGLGLPAHEDELEAIAAGAPTRLRAFAWAEPGDDPEAPTLRPARGPELDEGAPVLALLTTHGDDPEWHLRAGETLARVLLRGRVDHLWASFFGPLVEVERTRAALRERLGLAGWPQVALRLGYAGDVAPTPRLDLAEVLEEA
ncbi:MAG: nitroreductase [Myxococcales bacterium]|nr:nitroreductase [Myxococcales bacterium]